MTNEELALKIQRGEDVQESLEALYMQNIGLINKIVARYAGIEDPEDLKQEAFFAIRKAALLWSPVAGAGFAHYAGIWIKQILLRYIENCGGVVRVPVSQRARIRRYHRTVNRFKMDLGRDPEPVELCFALDINADQLEDLQRDINALRIRSTSEVIGGEDDDLSLEDTLQAAGDPMGDVLDRIQAEELQRVLWGVVDELKGRQADVIRERYRDGLTLKECGDLHGISTERIRQIENNALRAMRTGRSRRVLIPFFTESGAYATGLRGSLAAFKRSHISPQEHAIMYLEERMKWGNLQGAVIQV